MAPVIEQQQQRKIIIGKSPRSQMAEQNRRKKNKPF